MHGLHNKITIGNRDTNTGAISNIHADTCLDVELRQSKYLNNPVGQDHQVVKRSTISAVGFKLFWGVPKLDAGVEAMLAVEHLFCPALWFSITNAASLDRFKLR